MGQPIMMCLFACLPHPVHPGGVFELIRLSFDLDWMHQRLLNIRVDGLLVAEEETRRAA